MESSFNPVENVAKKFFDKPEGKVGKVFLVILGAGALFLLYYLLPYIIVLFQNLLYAIGLLVALAVVIFLLQDKKFRFMISFGYQSLMAGITGIFVEINPIGIIKMHIANMRKSIQKMEVHMGTLSGQIRDLKNTINENAKSIQSNMSMASAAKKKNKTLMMKSYSRKANRRVNSNMEYSEMLNRMVQLKARLDKMKEVAIFVVEDLDDDVKVKVKRYETVKAGHAAFESAMKAMNGDPDERAMFELALEKMEQEVSMKLGNMERFIEISAGVIETVDIQNGMFEEEGMKMLEDFELNGFDAMLNTVEQGHKKTSMPHAFMETPGTKALDETPAHSPADHDANGKYTDYLKL